MPAIGKLVKATYPNGDRLAVEFREIESLADLERRYRPWRPADVARRLADVGVDPRPRGYGEHVERLGIEFPVAAVDVQMKVAGAPIEFGARQTKLGTNRLIGNWVGRSPVGFDIAALA